MTCVSDLSERFGVSTAFVTQALERTGYNVAAATAALPLFVVERFEQEYGPRIEALKPKPKSRLAAAAALNPAAVQEVEAVGHPHRSHVDRSQPVKHVMRIAHSRRTAGRDKAGNRVPRLMVDPGRVHAIDAAGTWDGDPWAGRVVPGTAHFYSGTTSSGPSAACGAPHMRAVLSEEFVPADDPISTNQCPKCAEIVKDGRGFRNPPGTYISTWCEAYVNVRIDDAVRHKSCKLRWDHEGAHRARDGSEWFIGVDDYVPSSDELGRGIAGAS